MKIWLTLTDAAGVMESVSEEASEVARLTGATGSRFNAERMAAEDVILANLRPYVDDMESITVEIDTKTGATRVVPLDEL